MARAEKIKSPHGVKTFYYSEGANGYMAKNKKSARSGNPQPASRRALPEPPLPPTEAGTEDEKKETKTTEGEPQAITDDPQEASAEIPQEAKTAPRVAPAPSRPVAAPAKPAIMPGPARPAGFTAGRLQPPKKAAKTVRVDDAFNHDVAFKFSFLGAGQGGGKMADSFWKLGYRRVGILNTTDMDFEGITEDIPKFNLAIGGARKDPTVAKANLEGREDDVWNLLTKAWGKETEYGIITVGLGGGTGSGTVGTLIKVAREYMEDQGHEPRVGALVSLPTPDEGQTVCRNAVKAFEEIYQAGVSPLIVIDNERIHQLYEPGFGQLHEIANSNASWLLHLFNQLAAFHSPYITFDRSEFGSLLDGGINVFGVGDILEVRDPSDVAQAIDQHLRSNVLAGVDLNAGGEAACLFVADDDTLNSLSKDFYAAGFTKLDRMLGGGTVHRGVYPGADPGLQCYTMISQLPPPREQLKLLAKKGAITAASSQSMAKFLQIDD